MKTIKNLCKRAAALVLAAVIFSASVIPTGAAIALDYQGYYYCSVDASFHIFFPTGTTSNFRGPFSSLSSTVPGGTFAATDAVPNSMKIDLDYSTDNLEVRYMSYARLIGDSYVHQNGDFLLVGTVLSESEIRIKGMSSFYWYYK